MSADLSLTEIKKEWHGSARSYVIGLITSLTLTLTSFSLVMSRALPGPTLVYTIAGLAMLQAILQLVFFLHVGQEASPHWETLIFLFMVLILIIIVAGSLWIMWDLNARVMGDMPMEMP